MDGSSAEFFVNGSLSNGFRVTVGVRQGDALPATLFNLALRSVKNTNKSSHKHYIQYEIRCQSLTIR